jgi:hypothetical protein
MFCYVKMCCYVRLCVASDYVFVYVNMSYYEMILYLRPCVTICCFVQLSVTMYENVLDVTVFECVTMCDHLTNLFYTNK